MSWSWLRSMVCGEWHKKSREWYRKGKKGEGRVAGIPCYFSKVARNTTPHAGREREGWEFFATFEK
jgi:hypothetical protein